MPTIAQSLWLPVGRANFFTVPGDLELLRSSSHNGQHECSAKMTPDPPALQVSSMRRLLEVLPAYYGYDETGEYQNGLELGDNARPVLVTLTLTPSLEYKGVASQRRIDANGDLVRAGITKVSLTAGEDGFFTWCATLPPGTSQEGHEQAAKALRIHIREPFGGAFSLRRFDQESQLSGDVAVDLYRGAGGRGASDATNGSASKPGIAPLGILTFFQMNTLIEGLINETLIPAVFFEDYEFLQNWVSNDAEGRGFRSVGGFVELLLVDADATKTLGRITALDHFLAVTAREVLQKIKWSIESVRRGLLDEMMSVLHRQSSLTQLTLGEIERSPEQATGANESQLRGYVMLAAAKLPLITNVERFAASAASRIGMDLAPDLAPGLAPDPAPGQAHADADAERWVSSGSDLITVEPLARNASDGFATSLAEKLTDLEYQLSEWQGLLKAVEDNISGLEKAIEHAWMERLLYEQEQVRAEQEAMAEIERSRNGRRPLISSESVINAGVLVFAVAAVVLTARTAASPKPNQSAWSILLLPSILGIAVLAAAVGWAVLTRYLKILRTRTDVYDYEFAFRLDIEVDEAKVRQFLKSHKPTDVANTGFRKFKIVRLGGARIERITPDSSLVKLHSAILVRTDQAFWRRSRERFEVVTEILAHRVSSKNQYVLRETRIFGDTSRPLAAENLVAFVKGALIATAGQVVSKKLDVNKVLNLATPVFCEPDLELSGVGER